MIKLYHVISDTNIGGAGTLLLNYLKNVDRDSFAITVVVPRGSALTERITALGFPVIETEHGSIPPYLPRGKARYRPHPFLLLC